ncbi:MAG: hypothetical protein GFH27_549289n198 [Chloroflexi bacterium AL-W]|nr:hypothetical protein [Chloroflexi bacterium AL-N1]NOK66931.1 hypothetical protein [Chloroflexi bacterium AL-N10]NOK74777.1 hypothetical protein [Chloroflexi bacterium AL-N5]NOK81533.1 hypothetical protein [Chloroflexi bacterium AL-W]NOK89003.1 hypothetical protein [Chloroflexi bacterium AL-N15]
MLCPNCETPILEGAVYCPVCSIRVSRSTSSSTKYPASSSSSTPVLSSNAFDNNSPQLGSAHVSQNGENVIPDYHMVQIPRIFPVRGHANEAAIFLQNMVNEYSAAGWDFYRVDAIGVVRPPGCIGALLGERETVKRYYIVTFKRAKSST